MFFGIKRVALFAGILLSLLFASEGFAASITKCSSKTRRCIVSIEKGIVGDPVNVLNEKAQLVATGWIIKRQGAYGVIGFKHVLRSVRTGYPVIVNTKRRTNEVKWASAFGRMSELQGDGSYN